MKIAKLLITGLFPFLIFDILLGITSPPVILVTVVLALAYAKYRADVMAGKKPAILLTLIFILYWLAMVIIILYLGRILYHFMFYRVVIIMAAAGLLFPAISRKWRPEISAGVLLNLCALLFASFMLPQAINDETVALLKNEKYARPVFTFVDLSEKEIGNIRPTSEGVRCIIADNHEKALYFTVDSGAAGKGNGHASANKFAVSLARVGLDMREDKKIFGGDRLFGIAFTPDEEKLLVTDYYGEKLLIFDPDTLQLMDSRETSSRPQFIIVDQRGERVTVTHEGLGIATIYSLPDLEFHKKEKMASAPGKIAVDLETRTLYAANFQYLYMLTEVEIFSLKTSRKKFPFSFDSAGVDLDMKRNRVYVTKGLDGRIIGVDRKTWEVVDRIETMPFVRPICVDERRDLILVGNMVDPYIRVYGFDGNMIGEIFIGPNCREIYQTPRTGRVFAGSNLGLMELKLDEMLDDIKADKDKSLKEEKEKKEQDAKKKSKLFGEVEKDKTPSKEESGNQKGSEEEKVSPIEKESKKP